MRESAVTNQVSQTEFSPSQPMNSGIAVNPSIPVAAIEGWKRQATMKLVRCLNLSQNWDGHGTNALGRTVIQSAIEFIRHIPGDMYPVPLVVPVSGGGLHLEWQMGDREVEIAISPRGRIEALKVEHGVPVEDDSEQELATLFGWLAGR
jgi:hypothetical protein